jgi:nucleotide-binding universal stress UspA family protein
MASSGWRFAQEMDGHTKIICPIDFSQPAAVALDVAVVMAERIEAEIVLVHAVAPLAPPPEASTFLDGKREQDLAKSAKKKLRDLAKENVPDVIRLRSIVAIGEPSEVVTQISKEERVSFIFMASHGESGWESATLGSVAERVIRSACCLVLIVPRPTDENDTWTTFVQHSGSVTSGSEL